MLFDAYLHSVDEELSSQVKPIDENQSSTSFLNHYLRNVHTIFTMGQSNYIIHASYKSPFFFGHTGIEQEILFTTRTDPDAGLHMIGVRTINLDALGGRGKEAKKRSGRKRKDDFSKGLVEIIAPSGLVFAPDPTAPYTSCRLICIQHLIGANKAYTELACYTGLEAGTFCDSVIFSLEQNQFLKNFLFEASSYPERCLGWTSVYQGHALELLEQKGGKSFCVRGCYVTSVQTDRLGSIARELSRGAPLPGMIIVHGSEEYPGGLRVVNFTHNDSFRSIGFGDGSATYHARISTEGSIGVSLKGTCIHILPPTNTSGQRAVQVEILPSKFSFKLLGPNRAMMAFVLTIRLPPDESGGALLGALTQAVIFSIYSASLMHNTSEYLGQAFPRLTTKIHTIMGTISSVTPGTIAKALDDIVVQILGPSEGDGGNRFRLLGPANVTEKIRQGQIPSSSKLKSLGAYIPHVLSYQPLLFHPFDHGTGSNGGTESGDDEETNEDMPSESRAVGGGERDEGTRDDRSKFVDRQEPQKGVINTVLRAPQREPEIAMPKTIGPTVATVVPQAPDQRAMQAAPQIPLAPARNARENEARREERFKAPREACMMIAPNLLECAKEEEVLIDMGNEWTGPSLLDIPDNVLELIASYLPPKSAMALSHTCKRLHNLVWNSNIVCQLMVLKEFGWLSYFNKAECKPVTKDIFRMSWEIGRNWRRSNYTCTSISTQRSNHTSSVRSLLYIPEFGRLYSGASDTKVKVWTLSVQQSPSILANERVLGGPNAGALTLDWFRGHLFSGYSSGTVRVWNSAPDGQISERQCMEQETLPADGFLFYHPQIIIWKDENAYIWDEINRNIIYTFKGHTRKITSVKHFPTDRQNDAPFMFMTSSCDRKIMIWDIRAPDPVGTLNSHTAGVTCLEPIGTKHFASGSNDKKIILWDNRDLGRPLATLDAKERVTCLHAQNSILLSGTQDKLVRSWSLNSMSLAHEYSGHSSPITCIESDGRFMISSSTDGDIRLWDFLPH